MDRSFFIIESGRWLLTHGNHLKRLGQGLLPLGTSAAHLVDRCSIMVKLRDADGLVRVDPGARLQLIGGEFYVKSEVACTILQTTAAQRGTWMAAFFEGTAADARCILEIWDGAFFDHLSAAEPTLRLDAYDLPPAGRAIIEQPECAPLYRAASSRDAELYAVQASRFLAAPHVLTLLFNHTLTATSEDNLRFPIQLKKIADQLRSLLSGSRAGVKIASVHKSHLELWASVQRQRFAFLDGGVSRIQSLPEMQPAALRVGVYSVRPGDEEASTRERWQLSAFVLGDIVDRARMPRERPNLRRFHEAARLTLEPLVGLAHVGEIPETRALFVHGPLVNQFDQYDEGEPNFLPSLSPEFLTRFGVNRGAVENRVKSIPSDNGVPMWNQFMAVYGYVAGSVATAGVPIAGVVERPTGRAVTLAVLHALQEEGAVTRAYVDRLKQELEALDITDDFLFGCVLLEGEYVTPVRIPKNHVHRARERWQPVVAQYPQPRALLLKTAAARFPFRVELNDAATAEADFVAQFLYHTARLLPGYAFPVGLDIADKFAKIPDWISRGVSAEMSAAVLRRALRTGDANVVMQVRQLLAHRPRDFFYRPSSRGA